MCTARSFLAAVALDCRHCSLWARPCSRRREVGLREPAASRFRSVELLGDEVWDRLHDRHLARGSRRAGSTALVDEPLHRRSHGRERGYAATSVVQAQHSRVRAWALHRRGADHRVVLLPDPAAGGDIGTGEHRQRQKKPRQCALPFAFSLSSTRLSICSSRVNSSSGFARASSSRRKAASCKAYIR